MRPPKGIRKEEVNASSPALGRGVGDRGRECRPARPAHVRVGVRYDAAIHAPHREVPRRHLERRPGHDVIGGPGRAGAVWAPCHPDGAADLRPAERERPDERRFVPPDAAERDGGRLQPRQPDGRRGRGERLHQRGQHGHVHQRRRADVEEHRRQPPVPGHRRLLHRRRPQRGLQPPGPRVLHGPALLLPLPALLRGPDLRVLRQRGDLDTGPPGRARRDELQLLDGDGRRVDLQRQGLHQPSTTTRPTRITGGSTSPTPSSTSSPTGSATTVRSSSPTRMPSHRSTPR